MLVQQQEFVTWCFRGVEGSGSNDLMVLFSTLVVDDAYSRLLNMATCYVWMLEEEPTSTTCKHTAFCCV